MQWITSLSNSVAITTALVAAIAILVVYWRAGTIQPLYVRLLRLFIGKSEVEDAIVRQSLADHAALVSFQVTYGVRPETLRDARKLIAFADRRNIPLHLIGSAGEAFCIDSLSIVQKKVPRGIAVAIPVALTVMAWILICLSVTVAASGSALVSIKKTDTLIFLSMTEARVALAAVPSERKRISASSCESDAGALSIPTGFHRDDPAILCSIWRDPSLKSYLANQLREQRTIAWVAACIFSALILLFLGWIKRLGAAIRLNARLSSTKDRV